MGLQTCVANQAYGPDQHKKMRRERLIACIKDNAGPVPSDRAKPPRLGEKALWSAGLRGGRALGIMLAVRAFMFGTDSGCGRREGGGRAESRAGLITGPGVAFDGVPNLSE